MQLCLDGHTYSKSMDQPGKVASPARGQLNRKNQYFPAAFVLENLVSRDGFGSPVPRQPGNLYNQAQSGACLRGFLQSSAAASIFSFITAIRHRVSPKIIGSRKLPTDGVHCRESAGTGPVNLKVVPNESCLGRSPWTN